MTTIASLITSLAVVYSAVYSDADQRKHQSSASLAFVWGIHRDRWIPRTKGQLRGKCFHLMTSSCVFIYSYPNKAQVICATKRGSRPLSAIILSYKYIKSTYGTICGGKSRWILRIVIRLPPDRLELNGFGLMLVVPSRYRPRFGPLWHVHGVCSYEWCLGLLYTLFMQLYINLVDC